MHALHFTGVWGKIKRFLLEKHEKKPIIHGFFYRSSKHSFYFCVVKIQNETIKEHYYYLLI